MDFRECFNLVSLVFGIWNMNWIVLMRNFNYFLIWIGFYCDLFLLGMKLDEVKFECWIRLVVWVEI